MDKIDVSQIVDPGVQQPFTGASLAFLQNAYKTALAGVAQGVIGDTYGNTNGYVLYGVGHSGAVVSTGYIYFDGEVYLFNGISNYNTFSNVGVFILQSPTPTAPDPVTFSDGTTKSVHIIRRLTLADQVDNSGLFNYGTILHVQDRYKAPTKITVGSGGSAPAFQNSFAQGSPVVFRKNTDGLVTIQGYATKTTTSTIASQVIFTLPVGYRPSLPRILIGDVYYDATTLVIDFLNISTNGDVSVSGINVPGSISTGAFVFFASVSFYAD